MFLLWRGQFNPYFSSMQNEINSIGMGKKITRHTFMCWLFNQSETNQTQPIWLRYGFCLFQFGWRIIPLTCVGVICFTHACRVCFIFCINSAWMIAARLILVSTYSEYGNITIRQTPFLIGMSWFWYSAFDINKSVKNEICCYDGRKFVISELLALAYDVIVPCDDMWLMWLARKNW